LWWRRAPGRTEITVLPVVASSIIFVLPGQPEIIVAPPAVAAPLVLTPIVVASTPAA